MSRDLADSAVRTDSGSDAECVQIGRDFLRSYIERAPLALAIERTLECEIMSHLEFARPVLDVGCGDGIFSAVLFDAPLDLGIDLDPREIDAARSSGAYRELLACSGAKIPRPDASFGTILSNSVLEHIEDLRPVLREVHRLLRVDGKFYVTVPSHLFERYNVVHEVFSLFGFQALASRWRAFFNRFWRHYHAYDREAWTRLFEECGLKTVRIQEYCPRPVGLLNDFLVPFAGWSFICKKLLNRWFVFRDVRKLFAPVLHAFVAPAVKLDPNLRGGGILFFELARSDGPSA